MYLKGVQAFQKYDPLTNLEVSQGHLCYICLIRSFEIIPLKAEESGVLCG